MSGLANGNYRTGKYSKSLPALLAQRYHDALANPRLLSMSDGLAVLEARIADRLEQVETGASLAGWQALQDALQAFGTAMASGDGPGMALHLRQMREVVARGVTQEQAWKEIEELLLTQSKLVQTEMKTLQGMQLMITVQQHMLMVGALTDAVVKAVQHHVDLPTGRKVLMEVQTAVEKLVHLEERR